MRSFGLFFIGIASLLVVVAAALASADDGAPFDLSLIPARNHMLDALHFRHLQPSKSIELFFEATDDAEVYASSAQEQIFQSIVLEHSAYIQHVTCSDEAITIIFDSMAAITVAREWPSTELVLITNHKTCNTRNERGVYLLKGPWLWSQDSPLQITAKAAKVDWQDTTSTLELTYGVKTQNRTDANAAPNGKRDSTSCEIIRKYRKTCGGAICGRQGVVVDPQIIWRTTATSRDDGKACAKSCLADTNCKAFNFHKKTGYCSAFGKSVKAQAFSREQSDLYFYDRDCWQTTEQCGYNGPAVKSNTPSPLISAHRGYGYSSIPPVYGADEYSTRSSPHQVSSIASSSRHTISADGLSAVASSSSDHGAGSPSTISPSLSSLNRPFSSILHELPLTSSVIQSFSTVSTVIPASETSISHARTAASQSLASADSVAGVSVSDPTPSSLSRWSSTPSVSISDTLSSLALSIPSSSPLETSVSSSFPNPTASDLHSTSSVHVHSAEHSSSSTSTSMVLTTSATQSPSSSFNLFEALSSSVASVSDASSASSFASSEASSSVFSASETPSSTSKASEASSSSSASTSISVPLSISNASPTSSLSLAESHSSSSTENSASLPHSITRTSSDIVSVTTSATSSTASAERRLNAYELYMFSLFYDGMVETPEGYILADLGPNGTSNPLLKIDLPDFGDVADQARLRQRCIDAGLPSDQEFFALATASLAAASTQPWRGLPDNIVETFSPHLELSPHQPLLKRSTSLPNITDLDVVTTLQKRAGMLDTVLSPLVPELVGPLLEATCKICHEVYTLYNKLTDPFFIAGQICTACQPVLEIVEKILNPVSVLKTAIEWLFDFGKYRPNGNPLPPPLPVRRPPPPIEVSARIDGQVDLAFPEFTSLDGKHANTQPHDRLFCVDCRISVPSIVVVGKVVFSVDQRRVLEAVFEVDMHSNFKTIMQMKAVAWQKFGGSISAGSKHLGSLSARGFFKIDIDYTHTIIYDVETQGDADVTFGMEGQIGRGYGKLDFNIPRVLAANGWAPSFNIHYPSLRSALNGRFTISTQGLVAVHVLLMESTTKHFAVASSAAMIVDAAVMIPGQPGFGSPGTCAVGETQVDAVVGSETKLLGHRVVRGDQPLGRRCFKLKSLAEAAGAPPQPYCGPPDLDFPVFTYRKGTYKTECSSYLSDAVPIEEYRTDITNFNQCLDWCNSRPDCRFAGWESRDFPLKCRLFSNINSPEHTWYGFYVEKLIAPPPAPSIPPRPPATLSRPPIQHTTLPPAALFPFTTPSGAPEPPLPTNYPPRNEDGWCGGMKEGSYTIDQPPMDVQYDIECGTVIDYTGITLTGLNMDFETCLFQCRYYNTDCQAVMVRPDVADSCVFLTSYNAQRYSTNESVALAIKVRSGEGVNW